MANVDHFSKNFSCCCMLVLLFSAFSLVFASPNKLPFDEICSILDDYGLPELPFGYGELQPLIDEATVRHHHLGHHAGYTRKMNAVLKDWRQDEEAPGEELAQSSIVEILRNIQEVPLKYQTSIRNNGGGFVNHNIYWSTLSPNPSGKQRYPTGRMTADIIRDFTDFQNFQLLFTQHATNLFGSGYVWLSREPFSDELVISTTSNQDSVISENLDPLLVLDVWEHAYYLKHQNKRPKYIDDWWILVDWTKVDKLDDFWEKQRNIHDEL